jgi:hypothetical protein
MLNWNINIDVGFEVLTPVVMKSTVFWDMMLCSPLKVNQLFGGTYHLHLQDEISRAKYQHELFLNIDVVFSDY